MKNSKGADKPRKWKKDKRKRRKNEEVVSFVP
jgi:hypothetical protein